MLRRQLLKRPGNLRRRPSGNFYWVNKDNINTAAAIQSLGKAFLKAVKPATQKVDRALVIAGEFKKNFNKEFSKLNTNVEELKKIQAQRNKWFFQRS
ncbi:hypothetical protein COLO4_11431 [Corchorus olitorius]|uniref:Uncharacterized protein n=1 Tax=Corchorus olitorius TaxID=93759 RepID=A0A1R3K4G3_9ROSI|nr:hypothetical protein COLO4_11431 [Corchorus olitorius]